MDNKVSLRSYYIRSVHVYKVFLDPDDNSIIGAPVLIFKGLINKADIIDNPNRSLQVKWNITSHWGDFVQVNGRLTSDPVHRALDNEGNPQPEVPKKEAYAYDDNERDLLIERMKKDNKNTKISIQRYKGLG